MFIKKYDVYLPQQVMILFVRLMPIYFSSTYCYPIDLIKYY